MTTNDQTLVKVENLVKYSPVEGGLFARVRGQIHAVDDISFEIQQGKSLGLVGESGCGKTTTGKLMVRLYRPTSGTIKIRTASSIRANQASEG